MSADTLGGWSLGPELGRGGMGVVHRATRADGTIAALKLLDTPLPDPGVAERFEREARILARLDHPGIARFIASGVARTANGSRPWLAMEWIDGHTLEDRDAVAAASLPARAGLLAGIAAAVAHAHARGVIHRDLKPANIMVRPDGRPCILDFGVAGLVPGSEPAGQDLTRTGVMVGTVRWMSPEQVLADPRAVGRPADVHAIGLIAWWLLCGRSPYEVSDAALADTLVGIATAPRASLATALPGTPPGLVRIVDAAVAVAPRSRPTAAGMVADLARVASGSAPRPRLRPHRVAVAVLLACAAGFGGHAFAPAVALTAAARARAERCEHAIAHAESSLSDAGAVDGRLVDSAVLLIDALDARPTLAPAEERSLSRLLTAQRLRVGLRRAELRAEGFAFAELDSQWARSHALALAGPDPKWPWWWRGQRPALPVTPWASARFGIRLLRRWASVDTPRVRLRAAVARMDGRAGNMPRSAAAAARSPDAVAWSAEGGEVLAWDAAWRGDTAAALAALARVRAARNALDARTPAGVRAAVHAHAGASWLACALLRPGAAFQDSAIADLRAAVANTELRADPWLEIVTWFHLVDALAERPALRRDTVLAQLDRAETIATLVRARYAPQMSLWPRWMSRSSQRLAALELRDHAARHDAGARAVLILIEQGHRPGSGRETLDPVTEFGAGRVEADACDALWRMTAEPYWRLRTAVALDWLLAHAAASDRPGEIAVLERRQREFVSVVRDPAPPRR